MLDVRNLRVFYDEVPALRDLTLEVREGEIVALIGANGAGKSTALRTISGLLRPRAGQIRFLGASIVGLGPDMIVRRGLAHVPEGRRVFPRLTVEENLKVGAHVVREGRRVRDELGRIYDLFPTLRERRRQLAETMSGGEQQMLALGRALMSRPKMILLDEPSLGLAPKIVDEVADAIVQFRDAGLTVLLVEQNASLALSVCDRGYVIESGAVVHAGSGADLTESPLVVASYLGDLSVGGARL